MDGTVEEKRTPFLHARRRARRKRRVSALSQKIKEIELEREGSEGGEGSERVGGREYRFLWISKGVTLVSTDGDKYQDSIEALLFVLFFPMQWEHSDTHRHRCI